MYRDTTGAAPASRAASSRFGRSILEEHLKVAALGGAPQQRRERRRRHAPAAAVELRWRRRTQTSHGAVVAGDQQGPSRLGFGDRGRET